MPPPSPPPRRHPSRIALKIAWPVAAFAFAVLAFSRGVWIEAGWGAVAAFALAFGAAAYVVADGVLHRRLELARTTLKHVRQHRFEALEAAQLPHGDELSAVIWGVYRTGLALEKEILELRRTESYRREFLSNVSHELKTPIFAVQGFAETLLDGALDDERVSRAFVEKILRNTTRLQHLTRDLGELARIETGELKMAMGPFSLSRVAREAAEGCEPVAEQRHVALTVDASDAIPTAWGDRERIRQVVSNLVDNAVKYNRDGGAVHIAVLSPGPGRVAVEVRDTGLGLAPQHVPRLTERFFRVDKSRSREVGGTGLGLAIVKHILAAHESKLAVESRLGEGSAFRFELKTEA